MADGKISIQIDAEVKKAQKEIDSLSKEMDKLNKQLRKSQVAFGKPFESKEYKKVSKEYADAQKNLVEGQARLRGRQARRDSLSGLISEYKELSQQIKKNETEITNWNKVFESQTAKRAIGLAKVYEENRYGSGTEKAVNKTLKNIGISKEDMLSLYASYQQLPALVGKNDAMKQRASELPEALKGAGGFDAVSAEIAKYDKEIERTKKSVSELEKTVSSYKYALESLTSEQKDAEMTMMETEAAIEKNRDAMAAAMQKLSEAKDREAYLKNLKKDIEEANPEVAELTQKLSELKQRLKDFDAAGVAPQTSQYQDISNQIKDIEQQLKSFETGDSGLTGKQAALNATKVAFKSLGSTITTTLGKVLKVSGKVGAFFGKKLLHLMIGPFERVAASVKKLNSRLKNALLYGMTRVIRNAVYLGMQEMYKFAMANEDVSKAMSSLRGTAISAFAPLVNAVVPIIVTVVGWLEKLIAVISRLLSMFGKFGKATNSAGSDLNDLKEAMDGAGGSAEDFLASFDTIERITEGGGGGGSSVDPSFDFDWDDIDKSLGWLKEKLELKDWYGIGMEISKRLGEIISTADSWIKTTFAPWCKSAGENMGHLLRGLVDGALAAPDEANIGTLAADFFNAIVDGIATYFETVGADGWAKVGELLAKTINNFFSTFDSQRLADAASGIITALITAVTSFMTQTDWEQVGQKIGEFLKGLDWNAILSGIGDIIVAAIKASINLVQGVTGIDLDWLTDNIDKETLKEVGEILLATWGAIKFTQIASGVKTFADSLGLLAGASSGLAPVLATIAGVGGVLWLMTEWRDKTGEAGLSDEFNADVSALSNSTDGINAQTTAIENQLKAISSSDGTTGEKFASAYHTRIEATNSFIDAQNHLIETQAKIAEQERKMSDFQAGRYGDGSSEMQAVLYAEYEQLQAEADKAREAVSAASEAHYAATDAVVYYGQALGMTEDEIRPYAETMGTNATATGEFASAYVEAVNTEKTATEGLNKAQSEFNESKEREQKLKQELAELSVSDFETYDEYKKAHAELTAKIKDENTKQKTLNTAIYNYKLKIEDAQEQQEQYNKVLDAANVSIEKYNSHLPTSTKGTNDLSDAAEAAKDKWERYRKKLEETGVIQDAAVLDAQNMQTAYENLSTTVDETADGINEDVKNMVNDVVENFANNGEDADELGEKYTALRDTISTCCGDVETSVTDMITNINDTLSVKLPNIATTFKENLNTTLGYINDFGRNATTAFNQIVGDINTINQKTGGAKVVDVFQYNDVPRLAQGGIVNPGHEFMAILGDNKREQEIVSPYSLMKQALTDALSEVNFGGSGDVKLYLDGKLVAENSLNHINNMSRQAGKSVVLV